MPLRAALLALMSVMLSACTGERPTFPVPTATAAPTATVVVAPGAEPTPIPGVSMQSSGVAIPTDSAGNLFGLPPGAFQNSRTEAFQPAVPEQGRFRSVDQQSTANLGAPAWVKPGMRISFYSAAATIASGGEPKCTKDPNGQWTDQDGERYSCTNQPGDQSNSSSSSGDGIAEVDVVAVEGSNVVLGTTLYSIDHINNQFVIAPSGGNKAPGDVIDGVWIHPTRLAELAKTKVDGLMVLKGDYKVENVTYKTVSFITTKPGNYQSYMYDTKTGLLVTANTRTALSGNPSSTQLYIRKLLGYRQRNVPGMNGTNPAWVARTKQLNYKGTWTFSNPMGSPNDPAMSFPLEATVTLDKGGKNWVPYTSKSVIDFSAKQESTGSGITGSSGQYWIDPKALTSLKKGQVLDQDPYTQSKTVVNSVSASGTSKTVVISSELPGNKTLSTYDRTTGALVDFRTTSSGMGITIAIHLQNPPH